MATDITAHSLETLKSSWNALIQEQPKLRIRNAAEELGCSELELLLTSLGDTVTLLNEQHGALLQAIEQAGEVMALTRNDQVVHEKHGVYTDFKVTGKGAMGICLGAIDLRVFFGQWKTAVSVIENLGESTRRSIQFFDRSGSALHKIYCTANTQLEAWESIITEFTASDQGINLTLEQIPAPSYENQGQGKPEQIRKEWEALKDVHHFQAMLKRLGISRTEALTKVGQDYAQPLPLSKAEEVLTKAQERQVPIMVFVGNRGIVQIHTGTIQKLLRTGPWFNILDPDFNLHFNTESITNVWLVRRPTAEGIITSVEVYNDKDELVITLFGERKPGIPEREDWQALVEALEGAAA